MINKKTALRKANKTRAWLKFSLDSVSNNIKAMTKDRGLMFPIFQTQTLTLIQFEAQRLASIPLCCYSTRNGLDKRRVKRFIKTTTTGQKLC